MNEQPRLRVNAPQLASLTLIEVLEANLATAADRLLSIGQEDAGHAIGAAFKLLGAKKVELVDKWSRSVQLVGANEMPAILSKGP